MAKHYTKLIIAINENINSIVTAVKGDVASRFLDVQLYSNGTPIDLTSHTVTMSAKSHPDSNFKVPIDKFIDGVITDATNGRCQFELKTDILGQTGVLILQISIFSGQQEVLSTNPFNLYVIDGLRNDEQIEASNEFGALVVLFSEIQNALDDMHAIRENFGEPSEESIQAGTDTFWKVIEKLVADVQTAVAYDLPEKIGDPTDAAGTDTLFGKVADLSAQLGQAVHDITTKTVCYASDTVKENVSYSSSPYVSSSTARVLLKRIAEYDGTIKVKFKYTSSERDYTSISFLASSMSDFRVFIDYYRVLSHGSPEDYGTYQNLMNALALPEGSAVSGIVLWGVDNYYESSGVYVPILNYYGSMCAGLPSVYDDKVNSYAYADIIFQTKKGEEYFVILSCKNDQNESFTSYISEVQICYDLREVSM